ncbi:MAG TPA: hypothetical protein VMM59_12800 [Thermohalobaculum sp.]|nr:hypothetical protein [Thermohalobaculum sp.]
MPVARLGRTHETPFRIEAEAGERLALAGFLDVARVDGLSFAGVIAPTGADGWQIRGRLVAALEQTCVVSLAPVPVRHDAEIERLYLPADRLAPAGEAPVHKASAHKASVHKASGHRESGHRESGHGKSAHEVPGREVTIEPDEPDEPDPYATSLDPGQLALESLVLMLDPYPRAAGAALGSASFAPPGVVPLEDDDLRPFAGLAGLKRRLEGGGD